MAWCPIKKAQGQVFFTLLYPVRIPAESLDILNMFVVFLSRCRQYPRWI